MCLYFFSGSESISSSYFARSSQPIRSRRVERVKENAKPLKTPGINVSIELPHKSIDDHTCRYMILRCAGIKHRPVPLPRDGH